MSKPIKQYGIYAFAVLALFVSGFYAGAHAESYGNEQHQNRWGQGANSNHGEGSRGEWQQLRKGKKHSKSKKPSDKEIREALNALKKEMPKRYERLQKLKEKNPEVYNRKIGKIVAKFRQLQKLKKENPEAYQRRMKMNANRKKVHELVSEYRDATSDRAKDTLEGKIERLLDEQFELRTEERRFKMERMEERLHKLEAAIEEREKHRDEIIAKHKDDLLGKQDNLRW